MVLGTADVVLPTWVLVISIIGPVLISTLAFIGTTWLGLADFRRKVRADATEAEITLLRSFAELAPIADAREGAFLSEEVARKLVEGWGGPPGHLDLRPAVAQGPVSAARQAAVVVAIGDLAAKYEPLAEPGRAMLRGLRYLGATGDKEVQRAYHHALGRVGELD